MRFHIAWAISGAVAAFGLANIVSAAELVLAQDGQSAYRIVVADDASPSTNYAAQELQKFFKEITGAKLPIISDRQPVAAREIVLGDNAHFRALHTDIHVASLGKEGYVIRTVGNRLLIVGGALRGNLYGVYGLLEDHLGCRWFTPDCSRIPRAARLAIAPIDDRQIPVFEYREPYLADCQDPDWCARNRMNSGCANLGEKHGGGVTFGGGHVHTFQGLVPTDKYFDAHPEYFSLVNGRRVKQEPQLCCTNPDVIRICTEQIRERMRKTPGAMAFSVSQNDWNNHCECPNCQALAKQEGTQMGPVLQLVNRVAEAVEKEFPDKVVETLAYQWTRKPPQHMRPRPNVVIQLCSIECCFAHPLATCDSRQNKAFRADLEAWAKIAPRLWVWDYATDFWAYLLPFPNQRVRGPNIRFYAEHNVKGIYEQDNGQSKDSELAALGGYITAKCLWNPALQREPGHERIPGRLLRPGGQAHPPIHRHDPRLCRARKYPCRHLCPHRPSPPHRRHAHQGQRPLAAGGGRGGGRSRRAAPRESRASQRRLCNSRTDAAAVRIEAARQRGLQSPGGGPFPAVFRGPRRQSGNPPARAP